MEKSIWFIILIIGVSAFLIIKALQIIFFQPYRNRLMIWYMKKCSKSYRSCSKLFDSLIQKEGELRKQHISRSDAYYALFELMQSDNRFRNLDQVQETIFGKADHKIESETLITKQTIPFRDIEQFVYFSGKGYKWHKVVVTFDFSETIHLCQIWFFYHEEDSWKYYFELKKKKFPPGDDSGRRSKNIPTPTPSTSKKIPVY